jgi:hypothetical protein
VQSVLKRCGTQGGRRMYLAAHKPIFGEDGSLIVAAIRSKRYRWVRGKLIVLS